MFDQQHFLDSQESSSFGDPKSWLSGEDNSSPTHHLRTHSSLSATTTGAAPGNVDRALFNDLVQIVPLVQSLIDRKASSSFTRRSSMVYTKTPSRASLTKKIIDPKGRNAAQSIPTKKRRNHGDKDRSSNNQDGGADLSIFSTRSLAAEKDMEELREQVDDLQRQLFEKDDLLKSAEVSKNQITAAHAKLDELMRQTAEKDSLIRSTQLQLSDVKIKLADKQAALEKIQWEAMTSNKKVEKLQEDLDSMQGDISSFMLLFEDLSKNDCTNKYAEEYDIEPYHIGRVPYIDDMDEEEMERMEEAREAYIAAVSAAKEKQDEESIAVAERARLHLQSFVFRT